MNQYRMFFVQTSILPPRMHHKLTKHGGFCKQNNQLPTKTHVELKDNSINFQSSKSVLTFNMSCFSNSFTEKDCTKHVEHIGAHHKCQLLEFNMEPINVKSAVHMATSSLNLGLFWRKSGGGEGGLKFFMLRPLFSHELKNQNFSSWGTINLPLGAFQGR